MYEVIVVSSSERIAFTSRDGYTALSESIRQRAKTTFAVVLRTPSGRRLTMAAQDKMARRMKKLFITAAKTITSLLRWR